MSLGEPARKSCGKRAKRQGSFGAESEVRFGEALAEGPFAARFSCRSTRISLPQAIIVFARLPSSTTAREIVTVKATSAAEVKLHLTEVKSYSAEGTEFLAQVSLFPKCSHPLPLSRSDLRTSGERGERIPPLPSEGRGLNGRGAGVREKMRFMKKAIGCRNCC